MYALNLAADGRILYVCLANKFTPAKLVRVETLPNGDYNDYHYINGQYVYAPLPKPEPEPETPSAEERLAATESAIMELAGMIGGAK